MDSTDKDFRTVVEIALAENGFIFHTDNMYSITNIDPLDRKVIAKLIGSVPIVEKLHGTKNNTEIKAIGYFLIDLSTGVIQPDFYSFAFFNAIDNKVEFVIIPTIELKNRLSQRKRITDINQNAELTFWLLPDGYVFDATGISAEAEWYFIAGRMAENTIMDYTSYLNGWDHYL